MNPSVALVTLLYVSQHALGVEVEVYEGEESVLLPCQVTVTDPQFNAVSWSVERLSDKVVHQREKSGDKLTNQNQDYVNRTSMRTDSLTTGDLSLTLKNPTVRDSETYTCIYREKGLDKSLQEVQLEVKERPTPPWVVAAAVLAVFLAGAAGAAGLLFLFMEKDGGRVQKVKAEEEEQSVLLPVRWTDKGWVRMRMCRIRADPSKDVRVEWVDGDDRKLHVYENGSDQPDQQNQDYRDRTEMKTGDYSLILKEPTVRDRGDYCCRVQKNGVLLRERRVRLEVKGKEVQEVDEGAESVLLPVKTKPDLPGDVTVEWMNRDKRKVHVYQNGSVKQELVYRGRTEMNEDLMKTGDYSLILKEPTTRDTGDYYCRIYNHDRDLLRERRVDLKVKVQQVEVDEGAESVLLSCKTTPDPSGGVRVEWMNRDNRKVHVHQNGSVEQELTYRGRTEMNEDLMKTGDYSLKLRDIRVRDRGKYTCRIYNKEGHFLRERRVELWVRGEQMKVEEEAESVLLSFKTTADLPGDVRVEWRDEDNRKVHVYQNGSVEQDQVYRGRTEMKKDLMKTGDYSLTLKDLTVRDRGEYTCRVYDKDGDLLRERRVRLKVKDQQVEVEEGEESVLSFKTTAGLPGDVRVEWTDKDSMKVHVYQNGSVEQGQVYRGRTEMKKDLMKDGDYSLILKDLRDTDKGVYYCRVYDKDGVLLRGTRVYLKVKGKNKPGTEATPLTAEHMV